MKVGRRDITVGKELASHMDDSKLLQYHICPWSPECRGLNSEHSGLALQNKNKNNKHKKKFKKQ